MLLTFTYTKSPTDISNRIVVPLSMPSNKYFTIDVSDLDIEDQAVFAAEIDSINSVRQEQINKLMEEYDVRTNFRSFLPEKMSNIVEE